MTTRGTTETLELILLPLPAEEMDAEGARAWLADEAAGWVSMLGEALNEEDAGTRGAFAVLALDVERVVAAACRALEGEPVRFAVDGEADGSRDFEGTVAALARITSTRPTDTSESWNRSQAALRVELLRRLDLLGMGRGVEPRAHGR